MEALKRFEEICRALSDPSFYPHPVSHVERVDTHISAVFLTGSWVYKFKKPVNFEFLDFTSLDARHHFCRQEVQLNQRLSRGIYDGVQAVCQDEEGRLSLGGRGQPVEYAVKMRQLPEEASLKELLRRGKVDLQDMERLGHHLADFYERSERNEEIDHYGRTEVVEFNMEENFRQVEPFVNRLIPLENWEFIRQASRSFFLNWRNLFDRRVLAGCIRDGHGDLRTGHIYFFDGIQIIDCIEFNDRFRYGDVVSDLAFLFMDMEHLGYPELGRGILRGYTECSADYQLYSLLDFYCAYRAIVKMKVACLHSTETDNREEQEAFKMTAESYLDLAFRYTVRFSRPTLWVFSGLPASGKSTLGRQLAETLKIPHLQTDRIRKKGEGHQAPGEHVVPYDHGIYRHELRQRVYAQMLALAQEHLKSGRSVVLDGSFSRTKWREDALQLARDLDTNIIYMECFCKEETMRTRLLRREQETGSSDARLSHLPKMVENFEPFLDLPHDTHIKLDTDRPFSEIFSEMLSEGYAMKCAQIQESVNP